MCSRTLQKAGALSTVSLHSTTARHLEATRVAGSLKCHFRFEKLYPDGNACCNCCYGWMSLANEHICVSCQVPRCGSCTYC
ncbi:hypothetical protein BFJ63_vAg15547 [Fusarium oxysporum f. sp. narcissi]|uniref:Uncharacterized protein n=1 Tax=Fusarium oxysporum f. sp. narcissi TaxID=451672 RepID=A0A4Q2V493_FUSOX|nr:hypothetical protein BFJ70_g1545 [Fusarium oxysporum]RYC81554.1 hypothetical protein BFJ63_vAg15547 [Fusarium oxysporum f. sp. narcissi]